MNLEKIFYNTIDEFNNSQKEYEIEKDDSFLIIGSGSALDSLATVNFFTRLEKNFFKVLKKEIDIINNIFSLNKEKITLKELLDFLKDYSNK
tara:strand:+ start:149 stop:424 length:276 start_codon:yes stop_codon:yes gene_type:complete